jgi:hypothetical protein
VLGLASSCGSGTGMPGTPGLSGNESGWGSVSTLHCGASPPVLRSMETVVLSVAPAFLPPGWQLIRTPLGPVLLYTIACAPPELLAALDGLFPPEDLWISDPPAPSDLQWYHSITSHVVSPGWDHSLQLAKSHIRHPA